MQMTTQHNTLGDASAQAYLTCHTNQRDVKTREWKNCHVSPFYTVKSRWAVVGNYIVLFIIIISITPIRHREYRHRHTVGRHCHMSQYSTVHYSQ